MAGTSREQSRFSGVPWLALASLLVILVCIVASITIIVISNTQTVESWVIQPAVLLAILASISNVALGTAFSAAVVVTWWTSAIEGASLSQLHYIWDRGEGISFFSALAAGANPRRVVLAASVVVVAKLATNPLLQRATRQRIDQIAIRDTIKLNAVPKIPGDFLGWRSATEVSIDSFITGTISAWWRNTTIYSNSFDSDAPGYYCDGTCEGNVPGAGIRYTCSSSTTTQTNLFTDKNSTIYSIDTTMLQYSTGEPFLLLTTIYPSAVDDTCTVTLTNDTCKIEAGVVEYPVILQNSTVTLDSSKLNDITVLSTYTYSADLPMARLPLDALYMLSSLFGFYLYANGTSLYKTPFRFGLPEMFFQVDTQSDNYEKCPIKCSSPTQYILNTMQNIMFRAVLAAANATDAQTFTVTRTKPGLVFHSVYGYLAASSAIMLLGPLIILIMLQGWWVLGRTGTLSPLETAKAFCAPLMERAGYNITVNGILGDVGQIWVKYVDGVMVVHDKKDLQPVEGEDRIHGVETPRG